MLNPQAGIQVDKFYQPQDWQYSFPDGYTRLEYIESTGTQYIDTSVIPTTNTNVDITCMYTAVSTNSIICGGNAYKNNELLICANPAGQSNAIFYSKGSSSSVKQSNAVDYINQKHRYRIIGGDCYFDDTLVGTYEDTTINTTNTMYLMAYHRNNGVGEYFIGKFYNCLIWDNNTLIRNMVPVKRNSDGVLGMYDLVNNVFYTNANTSNTTPFIAGHELYQNYSSIDIRQKNNTNFSQRYKFNANNELIWANPNLYLTGKVNYTKVGNPTITDNVISGFSSSNYIRVTDNYLQTTNSVEIVVKIVTTPTTITNNALIFGLRGTNNVYAYVGTNNKISLSYKNVNNSTNYLSSIVTITSGYYKFILNNTGSYMYYSSDNITWTLLNSYTTEATIPNLSTINGGVNIGYLSSTYNVYDGSIDLSQTYIKVNDEMWFYGKNYTSANYAPVPAGLNYNNTTTPSIGYVNTQTQVFTPAPEGVKFKEQRDLTIVSPEDNTITLLYGVKSDFSKYSLFGLLANTSSGNYDVYIDDILYATTTSATQTDIDFSALGSEYVPIGTCTTPEELVLHKIVVKPSTSGSTITQFNCARTSGVTTTQYQGVLWCHFELTNNINISRLFGYSASPNRYINNKLYALTSKNDKVIVNYNSGLLNLCYQASALRYLPEIIFGSTNANIAASFYVCNNIKKIKITNLKTGQALSYTFGGCYKLEQLTLSNPTITSATNDSTFVNSRSLKIFPKIVWDKQANMTNFLTNAKFLYSTNLNLSNASSVTKLDMKGNADYPMRGLRGLKVSNEAPFSGSSPQINVSYTGLDRNALVELFNSLPDVSEVTDGITRTLNCVAATGNNLTVVGSPTIDANGVASGFSQSNKLYTPDTTDTSLQNTIIQAKFITNTLDTAQYVVFYQTNNGNTGCGIGINSNNKFFWVIGRQNNNGTQYNITSDYIVSANTTYWLKGIAKNGIAILQYSLDGINWINAGSINFTDLNISSSFGIGAPKSSSSYRVFTGSIDLENTHIKVGNNYLMKGYLLPSDIAIATNKGWEVVTTAS